VAKVLIIIGITLIALAPVKPIALATVKQGAALRLTP
jgi:hypothetical protein